MGNSGSSLVEKLPPPNDARFNSTLDSSPSPASASTSAPACPVDHKARSAWLEATKPSYAPDNPPPTSQTLPSMNQSHTSQSSSHQSLFLHSSVSTQSIPPSPPGMAAPSLSTHRVISSIPRGSTSASASPSTTSQITLNSFPHPPPAAETLDNNNWIYPSESQFFSALARKNLSPPANLMSSIVPIHNAVNERAWSEILAWESSSTRLQSLNVPCGGPKLRQFSGDSGKLTPKARMRGWLGYTLPFDRHDWVVERCSGDGVEYVIDFYKGRGGGVGFFLDVRPKLNSWEGWRMRLGRWLGLG
ncbi:MAG: hypothetical protein LQ351_006459 [Letrouitia transgressa]|nr:MAG: hypothetical protein LQ351_006459 [Letrouitia transgressa]